MSLPIATCEELGLRASSPSEPAPRDPLPIARFAKLLSWVICHTGFTKMWEDSILSYFHIADTVSVRWLEPRMLQPRMFLEAWSARPCLLRLCRRLQGPTYLPAVIVLLYSYFQLYIQLCLLCNLPNNCLIIYTIYIFNSLMYISFTIIHL